MTITPALATPLCRHQLLELRVPKYYFSEQEVTCFTIIVLALALASEIPSLSPLASTRLI